MGAETNYKVRVAADTMGARNLKDVRQDLDSIGESAAKVSSQTKTAGDSIKINYDGMAKSVRVTTAEAQRLQDEMHALDKSVLDAGTFAKTAGVSFNQFKKEMQDATAAADHLGVNGAKLRGEFMAAIRPADELRLKIEALQRTGVTATDAARVYAREIIRATDAHRAFGQSIPKTITDLEKEARAFQAAGGRASVSPPGGVLPPTPPGGGGGGGNIPPINTLLMSAGFGGGGISRIAQFGLEAAPWIAGAAAIGGFVAAMKNATDASIEFESSFAGVKKVIKGTDEELKVISDQFREMALNIPIDVNELNNLGEKAAQLGVGKDDLIKFVDVIAKLGVTTNLSAEEAGTSLAQLSNIMGTSTDRIAGLGSVIFELGSHSAATEQGIVRMGLRIAGAGVQIGLTEEQVLSFSTALQNVGIRAELGGTAFSRLVLDMQKHLEEGGRRAQRFADVVGVALKDSSYSADQLAELFKTDAAEAITLFIEGLGRMKSAGQSTSIILGELGENGQRTRMVLNNLAAAADGPKGVRQVLEQGTNPALKNGAALTEAFERRTRTTENQIKLLRNAWNELNITIGDKFTPVIGEGASALAGFVRGVDNFLRSGETVQKSLLEQAFQAKIAKTEFNNLEDSLKNVDVESYWARLLKSANNTAANIKDILRDAVIPPPIAKAGGFAKDVIIKGANFVEGSVVNQVVQAKNLYTGFFEFIKNGLLDYVEAWEHSSKAVALAVHGTVKQNVTKDSKESAEDFKQASVEMGKAWTSFTNLATDVWNQFIHSVKFGTSTLGKGVSDWLADKMGKRVDTAEIDRVADNIGTALNNRQTEADRKRVDALKKDVEDANKKGVNLPVKIHLSEEQLKKVFDTLGLQSIDKLKEMEMALARLQKSGQATGDQLSRAFLNIAKTSMDAGNDIGRSTGHQISKLVESTGKVSAEALPIWKTYIDRAKDINGQLPPAVEKDLTRLVESSRKKVRDEVLPIWSAYVLGAEDINGRLPQRLIDQVTRYIFGADKKLSQEGINVWKKHIEDVADVNGNLPDIELDIIDRLINSASKRLQSEGIVEWKAWVDGAIAATGKIPERALADIDRYLHSSNKELQGVGVTYWNKYLDTITDINGRLSAEALPKIEEYLNSQNKMLVSLGLGGWKKFFDGATNAAGHVGDEVLPMIEKMLHSNNRLVREEGAKGWAAWLEGAKDAAGKLGPTALPEIEKFLGDANKKVRDLGLKGLDEWIDGLTDATGRISDEALPKIDELLHSTNSLFNDKGMKYWEMYVKGAADIHGRLPDKVIADIDRYIRTLSGELRNKALAIWRSHLEDVKDINGQLPEQDIAKIKEYIEDSSRLLQTEGVAAWKKHADDSRDAYGNFSDDVINYTRSIVTGNNKVLRAEMLPVWKNIVDQMRDQYGRLPPELERLNREILKQADRDSGKWAETWDRQISTIVTDFSKGVADLLFDGGSLRDKMIGIFKEFGKGVVRTLIEEMFDPINDLLKDLSHAIINIFKGGGAGSLGDIGRSIKDIFTSKSTQTASQQIQGPIRFAGAATSQTGAYSVDANGELVESLGSGAASTVYILPSAVSAAAKAAPASTGAAALGGAIPGLSLLGVTSKNPYLKGLGAVGLGVTGGAALGSALGIGSFAANLLPLAVNPLTAGVLAAVLGGIAIGKAVRGKNSYTAGAMEVSRDFGGVEYGKKDFEKYLTDLNITEKQAYPIRKDITSSPKFLRDVVAPAAEAQGKMDDFLKSLENVKTAWGTFNFRNAFEIGQATGDWKELDKAFTDAFSSSKALADNVPQWKDKLLIGGDAAKQTAADFQDLWDVFQEGGVFTQDFAEYLRDNAAALDDMAKSLPAMTEELERARAALKKFDELEPTLKNFTDFGNSLDSLKPKVKTVFDTFLETGEILPSLKKQIEEYGGDLSKFTDLADIAKIDAEFADLMNTFRETGEVTERLREIFKQYGGDLATLDAAAPLAGFQKTLDAVSDFRTQLADLGPKTGLDSVLEGIYDAAGLTEQGLDPSKFTKITDLIAGRKDWESITEDFLKTGKLGRDGLIKKFLREYGGEEGKKALENYKNGFNTITRDLLDKTKKAADTDFTAEKKAVLSYLDTVEKEIKDKSKLLKNNVEDQFSIVSQEIADVFEDARVLAVAEIDKIIDKLNEAVALAAKLPGTTAATPTVVTDTATGTDKTSGLDTIANPLMNIQMVPVEPVYASPSVAPSSIEPTVREQTVIDMRYSTFYNQDDFESRVVDIVRARDRRGGGVGVWK